MPKEFCLETNYEETAQCLADIRATLGQALIKAARTGRAPRRPSRVLPTYRDFTTIERCSTSAALILASEFDRARTLLNWDIPVINLEKWNPAVVDMLDEIGFFSLLQIRRPTQPVPEKLVNTVAFRTGDVVAREDANDLTQAVAEMIVAADPAMLDDNNLMTARMRLFGALVEATENTCHHAYEEVQGQPVVRRWWMTGTVDGTNRHMNLVVYDQGYSIPATLPAWDRYPWVANRLARARRVLGFSGSDDVLDGIKIRLAMDVPRSSTGLTHRGKGFPAFKTVIQEAREGRLRIVSRRGEFIYEKGDRPRSKGLTTPLNGTLVEWDLWL